MNLIKQFGKWTTHKLDEDNKFRRLIITNYLLAYNANGFFIDYDNTCQRDKGVKLVKLVEQ